MDFSTMMALEAHGPDTFVGVGPQYPWRGLYGGQIVAQALRAAAATVETRFRVHSLHAYFIRRGDDSEPIRFEVDRLRNGRSFVTRAVVARQASGAILSMSASFQADEEAMVVQAEIAPDLPPPDGLLPTSWSPMFDRRYALATAGGRTAAWLRIAEPIEDDPIVQACTLAYMSDDLPCEAVLALHPDFSGDWQEEAWMSVSLDHSIWFHRPVRADEWSLEDFRCGGLLSSRGLALGHVFTVDGTHVATVAQEVLLRPARPRGTA